jgi:hypothetical protein
MGSRIGDEEDSAFVELFFDKQNKKEKKIRRKNKNTSLLSKWRPCHTERERERERERS